MQNQIVKDVTGDGVTEILITPSHLYIFGCKDGTYNLLMTEMNDAITINGTQLQLITLQDLNANEMPEIVFALYSCGNMSAGQCMDVFVYEWNGQQFIPLHPERSIHAKDLSMYGGYTGSWQPNVEIRDIDNNGTKELILTGGIPSAWFDFYFSRYPWRDESDTYMWNGEKFVFYKKDFSPPEYRYQAVQDGDRAMLYREYDKALSSYQKAVFDEKLMSWSPAHRERFKLLHLYTWAPVVQMTITPAASPEVPPDDPQEYPNLAAYARYRIMLLHIVQEHMPEAKTVYDTLQENFRSGSSGHEFALMAQAFWEEYQAQPDIEAACLKAIAFAIDHREILKYLGSEHHNPDQDDTYGPGDVCPFK